MQVLFPSPTWEKAKVHLRSLPSIVFSSHVCIAIYEYAYIGAEAIWQKFENILVPYWKER
jgi:hypothetical protein